MSWLSRLTPRGAGSRANRNAAPPSPVTADPETCLMVFQNHWRQVSWVLEQQEVRGPGGAGDDLIAVRNHTDQMMRLLAEERPGPGASAGPILELAVSENILERLLQWHLSRGLDSHSQGALLGLFDMLTSRSRQPLLQHAAVLRPLLRLLGACCPPALEGPLVLLLHQVCACVARQPGALELLLRATPGPCPGAPGPTGLLVLSLLVPFVHRDGATGQQARDALLLVMATSAGNHGVARHIAENSYFCPVLATGLSALYSSLPRKIEARGDDWHALQREDWVGVPSLVLFMNSLEFCNAVIQVAHPLLRSQLVDYVHNGFLVPVMGPALHKSSAEEMIASTAYLDLFLRSVTETALLKTFLRFVLLHRHDNDTILDTLLTRISSNSRLCMVSLSLFRTLLSLNCEDLMLQLILRYLLPCTHVMLSQRRAVRETDIYGKSADKFLSLIPECCRLDTAPSGDQEDDPASGGKVPGSPSVESPVPPKPSTPSRLALFIRQQSSGGGGPPEMAPASPRGSPSPDSPAPQDPEGPDSELGYLEYLRDARRGLELCSWGCRDWSAPYDGENPSPNSAPAPPPPPTAAPSLSMVAEHFSLNPTVAPSNPANPAPSSAVPAPGVAQHSADAGQQRAEWSSSDRDSGEWDVTISNSNCISLTPRSKKRGLQPEEPLEHAAPPPPSPLQALCNGAGQGEGGMSLESQDGGMVEVKKVKREVKDDGGPPESWRPASDAVGEGRVSQESLSQSTLLPPTPAPTASLVQEMNYPAPAQGPPGTPRPPEAAAPSRGLESVESLIEELLERAPLAPQGGDSGGQGVSVEAFLTELHELEEQVQERRALAPPRDPPTHEEDPPPCPLDSEPRPERSTQEVFGPARPIGLPLSQPYTGPFMMVLFAKLECMLQNSLYVNILLTGHISGTNWPASPLCSDPSSSPPTWSSALLSNPSIQVLGSVKNRVEAFAATQEDFPAMLRKARRYLVARGKLDWTDPLGMAVPNLRRSNSLVKSRRPSFGDLLLRHTHSPTRARQAAQLALAHVRDGALFRGGPGAGALGPEKQAEALRAKNATYGAVVFVEFLKELAALAQEHAVAMPFPRSQGAEE
ncbi:hypothetical protein AAFF_G00114030 [Aldrovandia affinis]|uniref:FHF complex subunit HOOK-interacting protein 1B n=1 Tax=Aldrovandia affinis TaxID=143900 RepID=A0AAD7WAA0_9TELE|nr:hypothetical protein AAFF_G00114030 [Aldrovandia affinis]